MASLWSHLFRKPEQRLSVDDWAEQIFKYQGTPYMMGGAGGYGGSSEPIGNSFESYVDGAYKANGIVFACIVARQMVFSEARFQFQSMRKGRPGDLYGTDELKVLENPWPNGTTGELLARALQDADLAGNHYVVREGNRLRRLRPDWTDIILTAPPDVAVQSDVAGYLYRPGNTQNRDLWKTYPIDGSKGRVAHWSPIPDPCAQYRGMSWLTPVIREIQADLAATTHKGNFFAHAATPQLAVSLKETVTKDQFAEFIEIMDREHSGVDNAYKTLYLGGGADVTVVGANLQQMDFKRVMGGGETRIAAAARVHPVIVGLSEGMQGASLNAGNHRSAWRGFADGTMRPLWRSVSAAYSPLVRIASDSRLWYDDRDIAALREDREVAATVQKAEASTINGLVMTGWTPDSAKAAVIKQDWELLVHSGLVSVQLLPMDGSGASADAPAKPDEPVKPPAKPVPKPPPTKPPPKPQPPPGKRGES